MYNDLYRQVFDEKDSPTLYGFSTGAYPTTTMAYRETGDGSKTIIVAISETSTTVSFIFVFSK